MYCGSGGRETALVRRGTLNTEVYPFHFVGKVAILGDYSNLYNQSLAETESLRYTGVSGVVLNDPPLSRGALE